MSHRAIAHQRIAFATIARQSSQVAMPRMIVKSAMMASAFLVNELTETTAADFRHHQELGETFLKGLARFGLIMLAYAGLKVCDVPTIRKAMPKPIVTVAAVVTVSFFIISQSPFRKCPR